MERCNIAVELLFCCDRTGVAYLSVTAALSQAALSRHTAQRKAIWD